MSLNPSGAGDPEEADWQEKVERPLRLGDVWQVLAHSSYTRNPGYITVPKGVVIIEAASIGMVCNLSIQNFVRRVLGQSSRARFASLLSRGTGATERDTDVMTHLHLYKEGDIVPMRHFLYTTGRSETARGSRSGRLETKRYGLGFHKYPSEVPAGPRRSVTNNGYLPADTNPPRIKSLSTALVKREGVPGVTVISTILEGDPSLTRVYEAGKREERLAVILITSCAVVHPSMSKATLKLIMMYQRAADLDWARFNPYSPAGPGWGAAGPALSAATAGAVSALTNIAVPEKFRKELDAWRKLGRKKTKKKTKRYFGPLTAVEAAAEAAAELPAELHISALGEPGPAPGGVFRFSKPEEGFANVLGGNSNEEATGPRVSIGQERVLLSLPRRGQVPYQVFLRQGNGSLKPRLRNTTNENGNPVKTPYASLDEIVGLVGAHPGQVYLYDRGDGRHYPVAIDDTPGPSEFPHLAMLTAYGPVPIPLRNITKEQGAGGARYFRITPFMPIHMLETLDRENPGRILVRISGSANPYRFVPDEPMAGRTALSLWIRVPNGEMLRLIDVRMNPDTLTMSFIQYYSDEELRQAYERYQGNLYTYDPTTNTFTKVVLPAAAAAAAGEGEEDAPDEGLGI